MDDFIREINQEFDDFRNSIMSEYTEFLRNPWKEFEITPPIPKPEDDKIPPVVFDDNKEDDIVYNHPIVIDTIINPPPAPPRPQPVEPIEEVPVNRVRYLEYTSFGTPMKVRLDVDRIPTLKYVSEKNVADALDKLSIPEFENTVADCLRLRKELNLSDWAYVQMLDHLSKAAAPGRCNDATLLMAYLYLKSGYKMRFANEGNNLYLLFASRHQIFERPYFEISGEYYFGLNDLPQRLLISQANYPGEQPLSLMITGVQKFADNPGDLRSIRSDAFPQMKANVRVNRNLMDFYNTYPTSIVDQDVMTRWATYANTPMDTRITSQLYPALSQSLEDKTELQAVNMLLNFVQTGFVYEYDDKVWGGDRAFFAEESLYYPFCDCEDRAILFTRLVRDLVGLDCILIYYPGHLAAGVRFTDSETKGDYVSLGGRRYIVSDPTYINAPVGFTMPEMNNSVAKAILLKR